MVNGPFDARELISGFWMLNVQGHEEAVQRAHLKVLERAGLIERGREAQWRPAGCRGSRCGR